jgi:hypothetical protein
MAGETVGKGQFPVKPGQAIPGHEYFTAKPGRAKSQLKLAKRAQSHPHGNDRGDGAK